ncbi:MAG: hypothetical protein M1826_003243 [Phylliscum demangeonii]|nr:MAG: hypothetical protein M1826_003243 [Phylliscum demangeonii]
MWRDRTNLYVSYRQSCAHHPAKKARVKGPFKGKAKAPNGIARLSGKADEERQGLMSGGGGGRAGGGWNDDDDDDNPGDAGAGDTVIEMDRLPPRWADVRDEVTDLLADMAQKSTRLDKLHAKHVLPGFDDEQVRLREEEEIERLTADMMHGFRACQAAVKRIDGMVGRNAGGGSGGGRRAEETMARNLQTSLAARVREASAGFRKKQAAYLKKLRGIAGMTSPFERASTPIPSSSSRQGFYADPSLQESDADKSYSQSMLQQATLSSSRPKQQQQLSSNEAAIAQREHEVAEIAKGVIEMATIYGQLHEMVVEQGALVDRVDYNVERMAVDVKAADTDLIVASSSQRKGTRRRVICLLILFLIALGLFIYLIVKPRTHSAGIVSSHTAQNGQ